VTIKIGNVAARLGTTVRTLRFYEEQGLVRPRRTAGGTRVYSQDDERRFAAILALVRLGFSVQTLVDLAGVRPESLSGDQARQAVQSRLRTMDASLAEQSMRIQEQRRDIARALSFVELCRGCSQRPTRVACDHCEISTGRGEISIMQVIWDEPAPEPT